MQYVFVTELAANYLISCFVLLSSEVLFPIQLLPLPMSFRGTLDSVWIILE
jgi:hypothetical protein